jgi:predicted component of type VI protein secretion system
MKKLLICFGRLRYSTAPRCCAVMLVALILGGVAGCGTTQDATRVGGMGEIRVMLKSDPGLVYKKNGDSRRTLLHWAAFEGQKGAAELLLENGADVNAKDINKDTPLHLAAFRGSKEVVDLLLAHGADVNARNEMGQTPLSLALCKKVRVRVKTVSGTAYDSFVPVENGATELLRLNGGKP